MNIKIDTSTIIKINTTFDNFADLKKIENLYLAVLEKVFLGKGALVLTIEPKKGISLGYEIGPFREWKTGRSKFLVNETNSCSSSMLTAISQSEEFTRGLLILMTSEKILSENIEDIIKHIHHNLGFEDLPYEIVYCENDGKSLCLFNTKLSNENLLSIIPQN